MRNFALVLCILSLLGTATDNPFPDSPAGKRARDYFEAFNSGNEERMEAFFKENGAEDWLQKRSEQERLEFYRQLRKDVRSLTVKKMIDASQNLLRFPRSAK